MEHLKLQIGCMVVLLYIVVIYFVECKIYHLELKGRLFNKLLLLAVMSVAFDGITAYTVNKLDIVNNTLNMMLHAAFLLSIDMVIFSLYLYMLKATGAYPENKVGKAIIFIPFVINVIAVIWNITSLEYVIGRVTNYSMGFSVYTCFFMVAIYIILTIITFFKQWHHIESQKRANILTYLLMLTGVTGVQMLLPETLISSLGVTVMILGVYMNLEAPVLKEISRYHNEVVMGFANLIENRDENTGGHIKRTSIYVRMIAEELSKRGLYRDILTKDYINNVIQAAPMHDIGKIAVPDNILQKAGKLTDEEYSIMKLHTQNGGRIIKEAYQNLGTPEYRQIAYEVARFHHEKWNGKGYPEGLKEQENPLCARIMAVADVFDAVSEKRCYRDAMPLDECFKIIKRGRGCDFDPIIVDVFLDMREAVEKVHNEGKATE